MDAANDALQAALIDSVYQLEFDKKEQAQIEAAERLSLAEHQPQRVALQPEPRLPRVPPPFVAPAPVVAPAVQPPGTAAERVAAVEANLRRAAGLAAPLVPPLPEIFVGPAAPVAAPPRPEARTAAAAAAAERAAEQPARRAAPAPPVAVAAPLPTAPLHAGPADAHQERRQLVQEQARRTVLALC